MKIKIDDLDKTYDKCQAEGSIKLREKVDKELIKSLLDSAKKGLDRSKDVEGVYENKSHNFSFIFTERYEILRKLLDAIMLFDNVRSSNHQCVNAYICIKHPELELDWESLETMRLLRNRVNYEGKTVLEDTWKTYKIKFEIYISSLMKIVEKKLMNN